MSMGTTLEIDHSVEEVVDLRDIGEGSPPIFPVDPGDDGNRGDDDRDEQPVGNVYIAVLLFIGAEVMFLLG